MLIDVLKSLRNKKLTEKEIIEYIFRDIMAGIYPYMIYLENTNRKEKAKIIYDLRMFLFDKSAPLNDSITSSIESLITAKKILETEIKTIIDFNVNIWEAELINGTVQILNHSIYYLEAQYSSE